MINLPDATNFIHVLEYVAVLRPYGHPALFDQFVVLYECGSF